MAKAVQANSKAEEPDNSHFKKKPLNSAIYQGRVSHTRFANPAKKSKHHHFAYNVFMMYLDLDELDEVFSLSRFWSHTHPALARFKNEDYFYAKEKGSIKETVKDFIKQESGESFDGSIRLLTNLRYFAYIINPISCYYCFDSSENLKYVVAEVTNTPWKEVRHYLLPVHMDAKQDFQIRFDKTLHVSPFMPLDMYYIWKGNLPKQALKINLQSFYHLEKNDKENNNSNEDDCLKENRAFIANVNLQQKEITTATLNMLLIRYPLMTVKVVIGIHWQAVKLFVKKIPFVKNKRKELVNESR